MKEIVFGNRIRLSVHVIELARNTIHFIAFGTRRAQTTLERKKTPNYSVKSDTVIILSKTTYRTRCFRILIKIRTNKNMDELFHCFMYHESMSECYFFAFCLHVVEFASVSFVYFHYALTEEKWKIEIYSNIFFFVRSSFSPVSLAACKRKMYIYNIEK